jgi:hypothetical protein
MRRTLGTLALLVIAVPGLAGCGAEEGVSPLPGRGSPSYGEPVLVSGTAGGGTVTAQPTVLDGPRALARYVRGFREPFASELERAARRLPVSDDEQLGAAVVSVGCDVPPGATVTGDADDVVIRAEEVRSPHHECFAPVTTVALVTMPRPRQ